MEFQREEKVRAKTGTDIASFFFTLLNEIAHNKKGASCSPFLALSIFCIKRQDSWGACLWLGEW